MNKNQFFEVFSLEQSIKEISILLENNPCNYSIDMVYYHRSSYKLLLDVYYYLFYFNSRSGKTKDEVSQEMMELFKGVNMGKNLKDACSEQEQKRRRI